MVPCRAHTRLRTRIRLWRLDRQQRRLDAEGNRIKKKSHYEWRKWQNSYAGLDYMAIESEETELMSEELIYQAYKRFIPIPPRRDKAKWETTPESSQGVLTREAMTELRAAIRKEDSERRAVAEWWVKVVGGILGILTGLIGALIGLVAVWHRR